MSKIFCIGLNKTGTISLHHALQTLGYRSLHWGGPSVNDRILESLAEGRPLLESVPDYDAYSDIAVLSKRFATLDVQYPGSRYILTTRPVDAWIESRRAHVERNQARAATGEYTGDFLVVDPDAWRTEWDAHHAAVERYFAERDDLLVLRITEGDGYDALCPFLGIDRPDDPFPWQHRLAT